MVYRRFLELFMVVVGFSACGAVQEGRSGSQVYSDADPDGNSFACATCHSISEPAGDGLRRPGHPLGGATARASYKNEQFTSMLDAVNTCREEWMATTSWSERSRDWEKLRDWLQTQTGGDATISYTIASTASPPGTGEVTAGKALFNQSCAACHGANAVGTRLAPSLSATRLHAQGATSYIVQRIRTSGVSESTTYDGLTGGRMPFWSKERLSHSEVLDLVAFLLQHEPADTGADNQMDSGTIAGLDEPGDCSSTHPAVGDVAQLETKFHGVEGTAEIVNDCTIRIDHFSYDAGGIDVRVYLAQDRQFVMGVPAGPNLVRAEPYVEETVYFILPDGVTPDDFNSLSIWCVDVAADFGSGVFAAP